MLGDHLWVCGGVRREFATNNLHRTSERFDTSSEIWEVFAAMQGRFRAGAAVLQQRVYVVGGIVDSVLVGRCTSSVECLGDGRTTPPSMTHNRHSFSTVVVAGKLYVCGGEGFREILNKVERFDPVLGAWELLSPMLHGRSRATIAVLRDRLYVFGGRDSFDHSSALRSVECYDPHTESWEALAPMLHARCGPMAARINGSLYVLGGLAARELPELPVPAPVSSAERYDPATGRWEAVPDTTSGEISLVVVIPV